MYYTVLCIIHCIIHMYYWVLYICKTSCILVSSNRATERVNHNGVKQSTQHKDTNSLSRSQCGTQVPWYSPLPAPWVQSNVPSGVAKRLCDVSTVNLGTSRAATKNYDLPNIRTRAHLRVMKLSWAVLATNKADLLCGIVNFV